MKLVEVATRRFRNLPDRAWKLEPSLQIIRGPNEAGKSALHEAVRMALYADAKSTAQDYIQARRWGESEGIVVSVKLLVAAGEYALERDFEERRNTLKTPDGKVQRQDKMIAEFLRKNLPFPDEKSFFATACVRQDDLAHVGRDPEALRRLIEQRVLSGKGVDVEGLEKKLEEWIADQERGWRKPAPKNPGGLVRLRDEAERYERELGELRTKWEGQARALEELSRVRTELQSEEQELGLKKVRLERHSKLIDAERRFAVARDSIDRAQKSLNRAAELKQQIPALEAELTNLRALLGEQKARLEEAERYRLLAIDYGTRCEEAECLEGEIAEIEGVEARLVAAENTREGLPLSREDLKNLKALPQEIQELVKAIEQVDTDWERRAKRLAAAESELSTALDTIASCGRKKEELEASLKTAEERQRIQAALREVSRSIEQTAPRLHSVEILKRKLEQAMARRHEFAALEGIDADRVQKLSHRIEAYRGALEGEGIEVLIKPKQPVDLAVAADGDPMTSESWREERSIHAARTIRIDHEPWLAIEVRNLSQSAKQLRDAEVELAGLLVQTGCSSPEEAASRIAARDACLAEIAETKTRIFNEAGAGGLERIREEAEALVVQEKALREQLEEPMQVGEVGPEDIRAVLGKVKEQLAGESARADGLEKEVRDGRDTLAEDVAASVRAEMQRKQTVLARLPHPSG